MNIPADKVGAVIRFALENGGVASRLVSSRAFAVQYDPLGHKTVMPEIVVLDQSIAHLVTAEALENAWLVLQQIEMENIDG